MILYLAGTRFATVAADLRARGFTVISPHELNSADIPRYECMRRDIAALLECEAVAMIDGWQTSPGAILEMEIGRQLGLPILDALTLKPLEPNA